MIVRVATRLGKPVPWTQPIALKILSNFFYQEFKGNSAGF